jgi:hypothetical protein
MWGFSKHESSISRAALTTELLIRGGWLLQQGAVRPVMITGDNAQCGYYIARSAALLDDGVGILLGEMDKATKRVMWKRMGQEYEDDKPITTDEVYNHSAVRDGTLELAITGNDAYTELYVRQVPVLRRAGDDFMFVWAAKSLLVVSW